MEDHYRILGLNRNATKEEIKEAFRNMAMKFHPDKHSESSKSVRDNATLRFKQVSEAYETLIDDSKRANYNFRSRSASSSSAYNHHYYSSYYRASANANGPRYSRPGSSSASASVDGLVSKFQNVLRFLTTRAFLLNFAFAGVLFGGMFTIDMSGEALWKMQNSGKSFEEAMESIEKVKEHKHGKQ